MQMDHSAHAGGWETMGGGGTFFGHWAPGLAFLLIAAAWYGRDRIRGLPGEPRPPVQGGVVIPLVTILVTASGVWVEMPARTWYPMDFLMGWQHIAIYTAFLGLALVELLHRRGWLPAIATQAALALGLGVGAVIFFGHQNHDGISTISHRLLALNFTLAAGAAVLEGLRPRTALRRTRQLLVAAVGVWFLAIAWILFRSGWDPDGHLSVGWIWTLYAWSWVMLGAVAAVLALRRPAGSRGGSEDA